MTKVVIKAADGTGAVESYHNANKKLETTSAGVTVTGNIAVTGTVDGRDLATDGTKLDGIEASATADQSNAEIRAAVEAATDSNVFTDADHTKLNGIASSATSVGGATGVDFNDNVKVRFGTGNDLDIYHDGTNSYITNNTGELRIRAKTGENSIVAYADGSVRLYYDNAKKLETTSGGVSFNDTNITNVGNIALDSIKGDGDDDTNITFAGSDTITVKCGSTNPALTINTTQVKVADSQKFVAGTGNDLEIFHDGSHSYIKDTGTGHLLINTSELGVMNAAGTEDMIKATENGAVELYYDNTKKFETQADGVTFVEHAFFGDNDRAKFGAGNDLQIYHDGTVNVIDSNTCDLEIRHGGEVMAKFHDDEGVKLMYDNTKKLETVSTGILVLGSEGTAGEIFIYADEGDDHADKWLLEANTTGDFLIKNRAGGSWETNVKTTGGGAVELYYDDAKQCETNSGGMKWADNKKAYFGTSNDLQIYHDASHSIIKATSVGALKLVTDHSLQVRKDDPSTGEYLLQAVPDGDVDLFYNGVEKLSTYASGCIIWGHIKPSADNTYHCGVSSARWDNVYATNTTIQTSDRNEKNSIVESDLGLSFINKLKPVSYKWNNTKYHKTYYGLIAQDLEQTLATEGKTVNDFAGLDKPSDGPMGLGYTEFISPLIKAIQELSSEVETLKTEIQTLKGA